MFRGLYSAATAMEVATRSHEVTSNNLANSSSPGYRARGVSVQTFDRALQRAGHDSLPLSGAGVERGYIDFRPGAMQPTGAPLDFGISGDGFFALQGKDGPLYTRNGVFRTEADGRLVSAGGMPVLGTGGPITLPANAGLITVAQDGTLIADGATAGKLQLTRFTRPAALEPVGDTLFRAPPEAGAGDSTSTVLQGVREQSNVQLPGSMATLVQDMRFFEASQHALKALSDSTQLLTKPG